MKEKALSQEIDKIKELEEEEEISLIEVDLVEDPDIIARERKPTEFVEEARKMGVDNFYLIISKISPGETTYFIPNDRSGNRIPIESDRERILNLSLGFLHQGKIHQLGVDNDWVDKRISEFKEPEEREKEEIIEELRDKYWDELGDYEKQEIERRKEVLSVGELRDMRERAEKIHKLDEELEEKYAEMIYSDDRFNNQFNETDSEMLLKDILEEDFEKEKVRMSQVHKKAKSLLKINK